MLNVVRKLNMINNLYIIRKMTHYTATQEQGHGFLREDQVKSLTFGLPCMKKQDTNTHDIPSSLNSFNNNESISIKTTMSNTVCCGDLLRIYEYKKELDEGKEITMIVIKQKQADNIKNIINILEIKITPEFWRCLFGEDGDEIFPELSQYVNYVKSIPNGPEAQEESKELRLSWAAFLKEDYNQAITINPKVDSKSQRRVQCSFSLNNVAIQEFITKDSMREHNQPNICRNIQIPIGISSKKRK